MKTTRPPARGTTKKSNEKKATAADKTKTAHLEPFIPPQPTLLVPFEPEVLRMLEIRAAVIGGEIQPAALVNVIVKFGAEAMTAQGCWWGPKSPTVVRFQRA